MQRHANNDGNRPEGILQAPRERIAIHVTVAQVVRQILNGHAARPPTSELPPGTREQRAWNLRLLLPYLRQHSGRLFAATALALLATAVSLPQPYLAKLLFDEAIAKGNSLVLMVLTASGVLLLVLGVVIGFYQKYHGYLFTQCVLFDIRQDLFARVFSLPKSFYDSRQTGYLVSRVALDVMRMQGLVGGAAPAIIPSLLKGLGAAVLLWYLNRQLTLFALACAPLILVSFALRARLRIVSTTLMEKSASVIRELQQSLSAIQLIKAFATEEREVRRLSAVLRDSVEASVEQSVVSTLAVQSVALLSGLASIAVVWFGARQVMQLSMSVGSFLAYCAYLAYFYASVQVIASFGVSAQDALAATERVSELLRMIPEEEDMPWKTTLARVKGEFAFEKVSFSYEGHSFAVRDVSFAVQPGEMVAIVGPSGAGKSTLVSLIIQLYKPCVGRIFVDGIDAANVTLRSIRERIGIVSQDVFLFDDTVIDNLKYGRPDASEEDVRWAAKKAAADAFIQELPRGYQTPVGERGVRLSAGQRQRIALARTILRDPDVLILDEPTSALDSATEAAISDGIEAFRHKKTMFVVAHRISTVASADRILVMDHGRLVQEGTHLELIQQDGLYRQIAAGQLLLV